MPSSEPHLLLASVIVPVFNGAQTLGACLDALAAQTVDAGRYEVIVVDDGSTDGSAEIAGQYNVTFIRQERAGPGAARNRGTQEARGRLFLFTDADCAPTPDWIEQMLAPFADPDVGGVKGVYRTRQRSLVARFAQAEYEEKYGRLGRLEQIDFVDTYAAAYRCEVFAAQGGFNPEFLRNQDQEFSFRLARAGYKLVFAPKAVVYHQHPATVWHYARRKALTGLWKVRVHIVHPSKAIRDSYTPWTQKAQIVLLTLAGVAALVAALGLISWRVVVLLLLSGLISAIPLMVKAAHQGWGAVAVVPVLVLVRTLALGLGLVWGTGIQIKGMLTR